MFGGSAVSSAGRGVIVALHLGVVCVARVQERQLVRIGRMGGGIRRSVQCARYMCEEVYLCVHCAQKILCANA